jgi:hypothetical protein
VLLIKFNACYKKKHKIMPRSVNSVAKRARRKNNEAAKGSLVDVKRLDSC